MNLLIISNYQFYGNLSGSFVHNQAKAFVQMGHEVHMLVPIAFGRKSHFGKMELVPRTERIDGVEIYFLPYLSLSNFGQGGFNHASAQFFAHLYRIEKKFAPDVILAHAITGSCQLGIKLKEQLHRPLIVITHGSDVCIPYEQGTITRLRPTCDQVDLLVAVSSALANKLQASGTQTPIRVVLNGFQVQNITPSLNKPPLSLIQAGYLVERKKADITIQAFAELNKKYPNATLDIVGSGSELIRFQTLCKELGISKAVHFHGFLSNAETLSKMASARFFVMPSVNEGFGIVYLEAMASGCITIGTEGEGIADLIISGENGFLVPANDPEAIAQVVEWCLDHPKEAAVIAKQGQADAMGLTWEKNAAQYIKLFEELIS